MAAPKSKLPEVEKLIDLLDVDKPQDVSVRVLPLKNVSAEDLVKEIGPLYRDALKEWNRVLRPGGRSVLLVSDKGALREAAERVNWRFLRQLRIRVLGQPAFLSVWRKE